MDHQIVETARSLKGVRQRRKPATLSTGLVIQVPEYARRGEKIRIHEERAVIWGTD